MDNTTIYDAIGLTDLFKEIHTRSISKEKQINELIDKIKNNISDKNDVLMLMPQIQLLMSTGIKNDEQLVKMAAICQKIATLTPSDDNNGTGITDEEKEQLLKSIENLKISDSAITIPAINIKK